MQLSFRHVQGRDSVVFFHTNFMVNVCKRRIQPVSYETAQTLSNSCPKGKKMNHCQWERASNKEQEKTYSPKECFDTDVFVQTKEMTVFSLAINSRWRHLCWSVSVIAFFASVPCLLLASMLSLFFTTHDQFILNALFDSQLVSAWWCMTACDETTMCHAAINPALSLTAGLLVGTGLHVQHVQREGQVSRCLLLLPYLIVGHLQVVLHWPCCLKHQPALYCLLFCHHSPTSTLAALKLGD